VRAPQHHTVKGSWCTLLLFCRDPYATFLAEYKRILAHDYDKCSHGLADGQDCKGGHVSILRQADFDPKHFRWGVTAARALTSMVREAACCNADRVLCIYNGVLSSRRHFTSASVRWRCGGLEG
jgi:hypothetical protein